LSKATSTISRAGVETSGSSQKGKIIKVGIGLAVLAFLALALWQVNQRRLTQRPRETTTSPAVSELALTYSITVQKYRENKPFEAPFQLAKEILFETDYHIRLNVSAQQSGFLYILNGGSALVSGSQPIQIPEKSWISFDKEKGTERVWVVFAPRAVPELEPVRSYASTKTQGLITDVGLRDSVQQFFRNNAAAKPSVEQNVERKETRISSRGDILVHFIDFEHH
jgi:hypothetical protein